MGIRSSYRLLFLGGPEAAPNPPYKRDNKTGTHLGNLIDEYKGFTHE